ncbi:MAG: hypothetical protein KGD60_01740 [Candidatus Thorarchaeota archaeon]|nr:hypothetical protein [Candidatus Thorarchaeota archaeon]
MVSRSLEKMMLIAIGLSTAVIVGVPVLMYAMDTINTTSQLQEVHLAVEQIHNATRDVDNGVSNTTTITVWVNPGVTVTAVGNTLTVLFSNDGTVPRSWAATYNHDISIDHPILTTRIKEPYTVEIVLVDGIIHISFLAVPI